MTRVVERATCADAGARGRYAALAGTNAVRFVWIGNVECESAWASPGAVTLPRVLAREDAAMVRRLEELPLCAGAAHDLVVLREAPDPAYVEYLQDLGLTPPTPVLVETASPLESVTVALLRNPAVLEGLRTDGTDRIAMRLLPFGHTSLEEALAQKTFPVAGGAARVLPRVNSKIFSRRLSREIGLPTVPGGECESGASLRHAYEQLRAALPPSTPVVLKEALGVSGKGLVVIDTDARFAQIATLLERRTTPGAEFAFVVEAWLQRSAEINYQFFVFDDGSVELLAVKESVTRRGVHLGHESPARLAPHHQELCERAAGAIGRRLFELGFRGVAGADAIIDSDGVLYPLLELNARHNMSTYELAIDALVGEGLKIVYRYYPLLLERSVAFDEIHARLAPRLYARGHSSGVGVYCFGPLNANANPGRTGAARGRLYSFLVGRNDQEIEQLNQWTFRALTDGRSPLRAMPGHIEDGSC